MAVPQSYIQRSLGTITYQEGTRQTLLLDRDGVMLELKARIRFTVTNGATGPVGPLWQTLARIIRRLEIVLDGQDTLVSISGAGLASRAHIEAGVEAYGMTDTVVLTNSAVTAYDIVLSLPFFLPRGRRPDDTALDLRRVNQAVLAITWGGPSDLFTTVNAAAISAVTCGIDAVYMVNVDPQAQFLGRSLDTVIQDIAATNANLGVLMDRGHDIFYRGFHIAALDDGVASNSIINNIRLESGSFVFTNREGAIIRSMLRSQYGLSTLPTGVYMIDTSHFGEGKSLINTGALATDLYLRFDVTKPAGVITLEIFREALRPIRV